jgi:hypothetical protein
MKFIFILLLCFLQNTYGKEINWELLKTLELDQKTKSLIPKPELKKVLGQEISIKGFMMPLDYDAKAVSEFLFMPYIPSCMHVPPPPPNQLVLVKMKKGSTVVPSFYPVELTGKISIDTNKDLESSYKMEGIKIKELKESK